jgi:glycosyltransferase involved in cell wall biosynthesis
MKPTPSIAIGIYIHSEPERLRATLAALREHTPQPHALLLLPDGPDPAARAALARLGDLPQLATAEPRGTATCFNRLAAASDADTLVLLESGALVGPGWLGHLLAGLDADPRNGLAGPSTNHVWNEQGAFPRAGGGAAAIAASAAAAERTFGAAARTLEPLYSLADFCYVVRRAVVDSIGAADEGYGLGPCWEMDYNIRAARAGWRGVWVGAAYVHRAPLSARRREEALHFERSRRRYQDSFCALRLRAARPGYEPHCRGDACEHFAPPDLIRLHLQTPQAGAGPAAPEGIVVLSLEGCSPSKPPASPTRPRPAAVESPPAAALISCIMPTRDRAEYALQALRLFQRQDYPHLELLIVDDGDDGLERRLPDDPRVRYLRAPRGASIGAKRNLACAQARGEIIVQWDDDDWHAPARIGAQAAPLLSGAADICGLADVLFFDLARWEFWRCSPELHRRLFVEDVHGGTLAYRRRVWERLAQYPDRSLAEDALFLRRAVQRGARLQRLPGAELFVYLRHGANSWTLADAQLPGTAGWRRAPEPALPPDDRAFYAARSPAAQPLVSCVMPTRDRRAFVPRAVAYFLRQSYAASELLVVDDGDSPVADLVPEHPRLRYIRCERRLVLGAKRNRCAELARGDLIMHWDDDDWHAPDRIAVQVAAMRAAGAEICGLREMLYYEPAADRCWLYRYPAGRRPWLAGNSLLYTRDLWRRGPFPEVACGEDTRFVWAHDLSRAAAPDDFRCYVALIHPRNTSPKQRSGPYWQPWAGDLRAVVGDDYAALRASCG